MSRATWVMERYQSLVDAFTARGGTDAPPLGDPESLEAENVLHAMVARLTGRPPLTVKRGPGLTLRDGDAHRSR